MHSFEADEFYPEDFIVIFIYLFTPTVPPRDFLNANLNLAYSAVYFIW